MALHERPAWSPRAAYPSPWTGRVGPACGPTAVAGDPLSTGCAFDGPASRRPEERALQHTHARRHEAIRMRPPGENHDCRSRTGSRGRSKAAEIDGTKIFGQVCRGAIASAAVYGAHCRGGRPRPGASELPRCGSRHEPVSCVGLRPLGRQRWRVGLANVRNPQHGFRVFARGLRNGRQSPDLDGFELGPRGALSGPGQFLKRRLQRHGKLVPPRRIQFGQSDAFCQRRRSGARVG